MAKWSESHNGKFPDPYENIQVDGDAKEKRKKKKKLKPNRERSYFKQQAALRDKVRQR